MTKTLICFLILISNSIFSQEFLNLGFEYETTGTDTPKKWYVGNYPYIIKLDTVEKFQLSKSLRIECNNFNEDGFGFSSVIFPLQYVKGKTIKFTGKIKTEKVTNGYAGIWLTAYDSNGISVKDNMSKRGIIGTSNWQDVSIQLNIDNSTTKITFGSLLTGQGIAWFDDFKIYIDGKKFNDTKPKIFEPTIEELSWLKQQIHPLKTYQPKTNDDDLKILSQLIGNSKVVALGETTHGSSEIFKMKHRIIKYLVNNEGFDIFSSEASMPEAYKLNNYIIDGIGNPKELLKDLKYFIWSTQEVLDMVEWMKDKNKSSKKIHFTGFDMNFFSGAIKELEVFFDTESDTSKIISEIKDRLNLINRQLNNNQQIKDIDSVLFYHLNSIKTVISKLKSNKKDWLLQNTRLIEQYLNYYSGSRDKYMAENLLWIKKQNPKSKIVIWAHNGHIKKTGNVMGKYLFDFLENDYLTIGFTFFRGNYTANGKNGLTTYSAQEAEVGSYEYFFNKINEPIFILDLQQIKQKKSEFSKWILDKLYFRDIGALKTGNEFQETDLSKDFDFIIFIRESSNSKLLD